MKANVVRGRKAEGRGGGGGGNSYKMEIYSVVRESIAACVRAVNGFDRVKLPLHSVQHVIVVVILL